jgi:GT2 family glycosyltransferase
VAGSGSPRISVLILNHNGREHLEHCVPSVLAQRYPAADFSVEVIDNGSTDGSVDLIRRRFPDVRLRLADRNLGFAAAYDDAIRGNSSEYVALVNNDARVAPDWLAEMASAAERHDAPCVASKILDWDGRRIDFAGAVTSFVGHTWQPASGASAGPEDEERPLLFACGGAMLIARDAYIAAGGFDRDFFAYFEDVDLGWRMAVLGYRTIFAPRAIAYHRLHGTSGRMAFEPRLRLYERNALAMVYKNYEDETLRRVLPAAVALSLLRGLDHSGLDPQVVRLGSSPPPETAISARLAAHLLALEDFHRMLPALRTRRAQIQQRRTVPDAAIVRLFGEPFRLHETGPYEEVAWTLIRDLGIEEVLAGPGPRLGRQAGVDLGTPAPRLSGTPEARSPDPLVSIVIITVLGATHLPECLSSLREQTYPADCREVIVVDNGSSEDPSAAVAQLYPGARVVRSETNIGFSAANNLGARAARGEYVVFINDDTRLHPEWLQELVAAAVRRGAAGVASRMLTWDGARIDFVGGLVNCEAKGFQIDTGLPEAGRHADEVPLLFACGGAMLADRRVLLASGGWDEGAWMYYEDVELGWRLWLLGHEIWFSPRSIVYHKHHGTWGRWPEPPRLRLYERNSLRVLYTHLERDSLARVLPAALLLAADRALLATPLSRAASDEEEIASDRRHGRAPRRRSLRGLLADTKGALRQRGASRRQSIAANLRAIGVRGLAGALRQAAIGPRRSSGQLSGRAAYDLSRGTPPADLEGRLEAIPIAAAAALIGLHDFLTGLPALSRRRAWLQEHRRRTDREILGRFNGHWTSPVGAPHQARYEQVHDTLVEAFGIAELAGAEPRRAVAAEHPASAPSRGRLATG